MTMRTYKFSIPVLAFFILSVCIPVTAHAEKSLWPMQKGEVCLEVNSTHAGTQYVKLSVVRTLGSNYLIQGENVSDGTLINGTGMIDEDAETVRCSLSFSGYDSGELRGGIAWAVLDIEDNEDSWVQSVQSSCEYGICDGPKTDESQDIEIIDCSDMP